MQRREWANAIQGPLLIVLLCGLSDGSQLAYGGVNRPEVFSERPFPHRYLKIVLLQLR